MFFLHSNVNSKEFGIGMFEKVYFSTLFKKIYLSSCMLEILSKQMRECSTTKLMEASQAHFKCQETNCTIFYLLKGDYWNFGLLD
jgi:hypothetical protein